MTHRLGSNNFIRFGKCGAPDFYIFMLGGKTIHLEVKNEKGKLSENQESWKEKCEKLGHIYRVVRGVDEVERVLKELNEN